MESEEEQSRRIIEEQYNMTLQYQKEMDKINKQLKPHIPNKQPSNEELRKMEQEEENRKRFFNALMQGLLSKESCKRGQIEEEFYGSLHNLNSARLEDMRPILNIERRRAYEREEQRRNELNQQFDNERNILQNDERIMRRAIEDATQQQIQHQPRVQPQYPPPPPHHIGHNETQTQTDTGINNTPYLFVEDTKNKRIIKPISEAKLAELTSVTKKKIATVLPANRYKVKKRVVKI